MEIASPTTGEKLDRGVWLTIGKEYAVVSVLAVPRRSPKLRILDDEGSPSLWDAELFVTVSEKIPPRWIITINEGGTMDIGPPILLTPGFWEQYFDRDPAAISTFEDERQRILDESSKD